MLVDERLHTIEPLALAIRHVEVHWAFLTLFSETFGFQRSLVFRNLWRHCLPAGSHPQDQLSRLFIALVSAAMAAGVAFAEATTRRAY
jgi:hypothetical protein